MSNRMRLTDEEADLIRSFREKHSALAGECDSVGIPAEQVGEYWYKGKHFSIRARGMQQADPAGRLMDFVEAMKQAAPVYPVIKYRPQSEGCMMLIDPADVHIGKLCRAIETGDEYTMTIAVARVIEGVRELLQQAQGFSINKFTLVIGNDILHTDNTKRTTTNGTPQDTDGMWFDNFTTALMLYRTVIEMLLPVAPVHVVHNPSNHDQMSGFSLAQAVAAWFRQSSDVTFDISPAHRKYTVYHNNLIGTTHGNGAKKGNLPLLMAHEAPEAWAQCRHRYFYTHHIHHHEGKDIMSVAVESMRSVSGADSYHHIHGYQHAPKAIEGFVHHPTKGRIAILSAIF